MSAPEFTEIEELFIDQPIRSQHGRMGWRHAAGYPFRAVRLGVQFPVARGSARGYLHHQSSRAPRSVAPVGPGLRGFFIWGQK